MRRFLLLPLLFLTSPVWAGDYSLTLSGDSSAVCTISFSTEAESVDGTHPLESGDITSFACTITEADPDLVLDENDLQYPAGLDYRVSGGEVTALDLQTTTSNELQIGNATVDKIDAHWQIFGTGSLLNSAANRAVIVADVAPPALLAQQVATMSSGEWKQLTTVNEWTDVRVTEAELVAIETANPGGYDIGGYGGSARVFQAWSGAFWDDTANRFLFWGGGHNGYGGNEVYEFDFDTLTWTRLSEPAPLTFHVTVPPASFEKWLPIDADSSGKPDTPGVSHTYGMPSFNATTGEMTVLMQYSVYPGPSGNGETGRFYTFDPDTAVWTEYAGHDYRHAECSYVPAKNYTLCWDALSDGYRDLYIIDDAGTETYCGHPLGLNMNGSYGVQYLDPSSGIIYNMQYDNFSKITVGSDECAPTVVALADPPTVAALGYDFEFSYVSIGSIGDGKLYMWSGFNQIVVYDIATNTFESREFASQASTGPYEGADQGDYKTLQKWHCFASLGVCAGIADADTVTNSRGGMWLWKIGSAAALDQANLGTLNLDGSTQSTLSVEMPMASGDENHDATAYVEYSLAGADTWTRGVDLFRQRPEFVSISRGHLENPEGWHGMVWGLNPGTEYDLRVTVSDPDGITGTAVQTLSTVTTKPLPISDYTGFGTTEITSVTSANSAMQADCDSTGTGHIYYIPAGTTIDANSTGFYVGPSSLPNTCGADADNPIIIRGQDPDTSVIDCSSYDGNCLRVAGSYVIVENLKITAGPSAFRGVYISGESGFTCRLHDVTVRGVTITGGPAYGITASSCLMHDIYIADNDVTGPYPAMEAHTSGGELGIIVSGYDIEVEHNTVSGYIDEFAIPYLPQNGVADEEQNRSIAIHHNLVDYGSDDAVEFDFTHRNVIVHDNLFANSADCMSFQPVWGGPAYAVNNVCYNIYRGPLKPKSESDDPAGAVIVNNTFIKNGSCMSEGGGSGTTLNQFDIRNNLFYCDGTPSADSGSDDTLYIPTIVGAEFFMDYNAWNTDNRFKVGGYGGTLQEGADFAAWVADTAALGLAAHDVLTAGETVFDTLVPDFDDTGSGNPWSTYRDPLGHVFDLDSGSSAKNAGVVIPGVTPAGDANPDMGACETGECDSTGTFYGVR